MKNECLKCPGHFYDIKFNICKDEELYVDKDSKFLVLCRYSENAVKYESKINDIPEDEIKSDEIEIKE